LPTLYYLRWMKIFQLIKIPRFVRIDVFYFKPSSLLTATSKSWKKQAEANQSLIWAIKSSQSTKLLQHCSRNPVLISIQLNKLKELCKVRSRLNNWYEELREMFGFILLHMFCSSLNLWDHIQWWIYKHKKKKSAKK